MPPKKAGAKKVPVPGRIKTTPTKVTKAAKTKSAK
jgi:hypothetical protein